MRNETISVFDKTLAKTDIWLSDLMQRTDFENERDALHGLRAVLHALRDALPVNEMAQFAAQLPQLLRGVFYEGWNPAIPPARYHGLDDFLARIHREFPEGDESEIVDLANAVFGVVRKHVSPGEITDVLRTLPPDLRDFWPDEIECILS